MAAANRLQIFEIFNLISKAKNKAEKLAVLRKHESWALKDVCRGIFDDRVQFKLPASGKVPYEANRVESTPSSLLKLNTRFKFFVKGVRDCEQLIPVKRERMFIDLLESIHAEDAEILVSMINKKNPVKGLTKKLVQEAYPQLIPE